MELQYVYLSGVMATFFPIWLTILIFARDQRREVVTMSVFIGLVSFGTCYVWWTLDWWSPITLTGTKVGIEDFLIGFFSGGIMSAGYEVLTRYKEQKAKQLVQTGTLQSRIIFLLLIAVTTGVIWELGMPSAAAAFLAMSFAVIYTLTVRNDLRNIALGSAAVMFVAAIPFYVFVALVSPQWVAHTYPYPVLTGIQVAGIPIEEFIFWFLAGLVFGPFYELRKGLRVVRTKNQAT